MIGISLSYPTYKYDQNNEVTFLQVLHSGTGKSLSEAFILKSTIPQYDKNCSLIYQFNTWKQQAQKMGRTWCVQKLFWMSKQKQKTIFVHNMFSPCSELVVFMYWAGKSMDNLLSYCGLVDAKIRASNLPVLLYDCMTVQHKDHNT